MGVYPLPVTVYSRLGDLLLDRNLTVADLEREIGERYGLDVDRRALQRLTYVEPIERVDMELAGAAVSILGVGLGDLFEVDAVPAGAGAGEGGEIGDLGPDQSRRLAALLDQRARQGLANTEQAELEGLVEEYGRRLHERLLHARAAARDRPLETVRQDAAADLAKAVAWWRTVEHDADWRRARTPRRRGAARRNE